MAHITEKPSGLRSGNDLDDIPDDLLGPPPRELRLGANVLLVLDNPPGLQETRDIVLRLRTWRRGEDQRTTDGETTYFCQAEIVTAWELGKPKPPTPDDDQDALFDHAGRPTDEAAGEDSVDGTSGSPEFSDLDTDNEDADD